MSILWRRIDQPGHEAARLRYAGESWELYGSAVFADPGGNCRLDYEIECGADWKTVRGRVSGWRGEEAVDVFVEVDSHGRWMLNGVERPEVIGCVDLDLNFSPSTNLLPIRRLSLQVGQSGEVRAAWLRFPSFRLEVLEQVYTRKDERTYRYESAGGTFRRDLEVNEDGFVTRYPGLWEMEIG